MKRYSHLILVSFLTTPFYGFAQPEDVILSGRVLDGKSRLPISIASIKNGQQLVLTDAIGEFTIIAQPGDHLLISHVAYEPRVYVVGTGMVFLEISLEEKVVDLTEVAVNAFISEERFKNEVLLAVSKHDYENKLIARNLHMIRQIVPLGYAYDFTSYNTFLKKTKNVHEVSFFSSSPSVGILKAIRQIGSRKTIKDVPPLLRNRPTVRKSYLPANDIFAPR
jgi:hypothetical protein